MTLLEDIQNSAVDAKSDLATLLRKCKLLAARLSNKPLEDWLLWESNGYPDHVSVPEYRIWPLEIKGHFAGPAGSGIRNAHIPMLMLPNKVRKNFERYECRQSIAAIEDILNNADKGIVNVSAGDLALLLGQNVYKYQNCIQAWAEFGTGCLIELLNAVRNRILDLALAVWKEAPEAGEIKNDTTLKIDAKKMTQIFNTTVYGGSANVVGSAKSSSVEFNIESKNFFTLERVLLEKGVSNEDISELRTALDADPTPTEPEKFGPKVSKWISTMVGKASTGAWNISLSTAGSLLAQVIGKYYGF